MMSLNDYYVSRKNRLLALIGWMLFCFAASISAVFIPIGGWYASINKPTWNPPSWVFGPVWFSLYAMMAVSAWLVWQQGGWKAQRTPLIAFVIQWGLNLIWTPIFFGMHQLGFALAEMLLLWIGIVTTIVLFRRVNTLAGLLLVPYLLWVSFAAFLNFTIWRLNR